MTLRDDLLPAVDAIRAIPGELGLRRFTVSRITKTWASGTVGRTHASDATATSVLQYNGSHNVKATLANERQLQQLLGSGHLFKAGTWIVGPVTPDFVGGGYGPDGFEVATGTAATVLYKLEGPGLPSGGTMFRAAKLAASADGKSFRHMLVLEPASNSP